jgi:hypothetical protein
VGRSFFWGWLRETEHRLGVHAACGVSLPTNNRKDKTEGSNTRSEVRAGGYFYRQITGGDSFTCMQWTAEPGQESDYSDYLGNLGIVDDAQPFDHEVEGIDLSQAGY